jgi:hypothetical protein
LVAEKTFSEIKMAIKKERMLIAMIRKKNSYLSIIIPLLLSKI